MSEGIVGGAESIVEVQGLTRQFGRNCALRNITLDVPKGGVFGLVGENGAGKTTLIKHLLGIYAAESGSVRVFGRDPVREPEVVLAEIGYLSEDHDLPGWMRIHELLSYTQAFFPKWDEAYADKLCKTFELDPEAKVKTLSRGQRAQAGLVTALAHRPALLVLDEPSAGLDAVVRRDILGAIIRTVADEGRTVLFSSHLLDEVERVADRVAMITKGNLVLCDELDRIKAGHHAVTFQLPSAPPSVPSVAGALHVDGRGRDWTAVCNGELEAVRASVEEMRGSIVEQHTPSLEDIFVARVGRRPVD